MFLKAFGCALLFLCCVGSVLAQHQLPADRELARERQERLLQEQRRRLDELQSLQGSEFSTPSLPTDDSSACLQVDRIELSGADALSLRQRTQLLQPFIGQCLSAKEIGRAHV